jgi:hypothetical protein
MSWQIGTEETKGIVGSRSARAGDLATALERCREYSRARHVKEAWLREWTDGKLGPVLVKFRRGRQVEE